MNSPAHTLGDPAHSGAAVGDTARLRQPPGTYDRPPNRPVTISDRRPVDPDAVSIAEVKELFPGEVSAVVSDDIVRNAEPVDDVEEEFDRFFRADVGDGLGLYPFGLVNLLSATSK